MFWGLTQTARLACQLPLPTEPSHRSVFPSSMCSLITFCSYIIRTKSVFSHMLLELFFSSLNNCNSFINSKSNFVIHMYISMCLYVQRSVCKGQEGGTQNLKISHPCDLASLALWTTDWLSFVLSLISTYE